MVFASFRSQTGIDFAHFGLESGMVFEETKEVYERIINKKEREICKFDAKFKKCFCWRSNRSIDDIIPWRTGLKTGVKNFIFWSEIGSGFREPAAHPHHEFPGRSTPLPPPPPPGKYLNSYHPPNKAIKLDGQNNAFKNPGKNIFNFLPDYITNFPLHPF